MRLLFPSVFLCLIFMSIATHASETPKSTIILTVSGAINTERQAKFDMAMLQTLPQYSITTHNPWAKGIHTYQGFSATDLLERLGSQSTLLQVTALNDYMTEIPISDFVENGAIFATHQDGKPMSIRNLGPIMVIYPFDERKELKSELFYGRSIWQIHHIKAVATTE
jgi:hypothetical protein